MLNVLWSGMILLGIAVGIATGNLDAVGEAAIESSKEAVSLCITMIGVMSFWMGIMKIGERSGLMKVMEKKISPILCWLFPKIPKTHPAMQYIATNFIAKA